MRTHLRTHLRTLLAGAVLLTASAACTKSKRAEPTTPTTTAVAAPPRPTGSGTQTTPPTEVAPERPAERASFGPVYFDFDSTLLSPAGRDEVAAAADHLGRARDRIVVEGHTDERGTTEYNLALGQQRASAVAAYLTKLGVAADRIDTITYGEERPADAGDGEAAWARNRRAELVLKP